MARKKKGPEKAARPPIGGPYLAAAFFCENILEDLRGMMTVQGISDGIQLTISPFAPPDVPSSEKPVAFKHQLLLLFRSGDAPGKHKLKLVGEGPSGKRTTVKEDVIKLSDPPHGGLHLKTAVTIAVSGGGLYLIDVFLDGKLMTRVPLNIQISKPEMPATPTPAEATKKS